MSNFKIKNVQYFDQECLIENLRKVSMLKAPEIFPYRDACISLRRIAVKKLHPAQRYVLKQELFKVRELKWQLADLGKDIFCLNGFLRLTVAFNNNHNDTQEIDLLPPLVEEQEERDGTIVRIINDGMHRIYLAYLEWVIPQVIYVTNVPKDLPYYAYPIPENDWTKIEIRDDIPKGFIKKWHRIRDNKKLYRNFNSAFKNVGGPRGTFEAKKA